MRIPRNGLALLLVVPWLASCVSGLKAHLGAGQEQP
jgi:hypothetical protein